MSVRFTSTIATTLLPAHFIYRLYRVLIRCLDTILNYMWWYEFNLEIFCKINPEKIHTHTPPKPPKRLKHISRTRFERWTLTHSRLNGLYKILSSKKGQFLPIWDIIMQSLLTLCGYPAQLLCPSLLNHPYGGKKWHRSPQHYELIKDVK